MGTSNTREVYATDVDRQELQLRHPNCSFGLSSARLRSKGYLGERPVITSALHFGGDSDPFLARSAFSFVSIEAARIKAQFSISYANAFAVATAVRERAIILTGDPEFRVVKHLAAIERL